MEVVCAIYARYCNIFSFVRYLMQCISFLMYYNIYISQRNKSNRFMFFDEFLPYDEVKSVYVKLFHILLNYVVIEEID